jgi:adenylate cyclase class 2
MQAAEIELKFPVADVRAFDATAGALGFMLVTERTFESNTLYDTADRQLRARRQILRLRQYGERSTLTHKRQAEGASDTRYKTRIETESGVDDHDALAEVFAQLGYLPAFRYEKFRTEWAMPTSRGEGKLVLDETPIGVWAELEGEPEWIETMLERMGVAPEQCITDSYGKLFLKWKDATGSPAEHLTFEEAGVAAAR